MDNFWDEVKAISSTREANVETWLVLPLLAALGYDRELIDSKVPVIFQEGRTPRPGRKPEADFVIYAERPFSRATSLIVVETKRPDETLDEGRDQGESYAQNLRTPILLMTNGIRLEIWQLQVSTESVLVLECDVDELGSKRGDIEGLLSRDSIKAHCASIEYKRFDLAARDLGAYEHAEYDRVSPAARRAIRRTLRVSGTAITVRSTDLLIEQTRGAVILGASGFGKTTLADTLLSAGIERRWLSESTHLPVEIFLPDLALSATSLKHFITERIAAHKPGFRASTLDGIIRDQGLLIIADGFERVHDTDRREIESALRTLIRDCPSCQIFITTRTSMLTIDLPNLDLIEYTPDDLYELGRIRSIDDQAAARAFQNAPEYVYRIGEIPLLADLLLARYITDGRHATNLVSLYEAWISQILASLPPVAKSLSRATLEDLSSETLEGPISIKRALELCRNRSDPEEALGHLVDISAISVRGASVELRHEALADYFRATSYWRSSQQTGVTALDALSFSTSSQFGLLFIATAPTRNDRAAAWQAVARADMQLAIHSLHFAAGSELLSDNNIEVEAVEFLNDINSTIENLICAHLEPVGHLLRREIAGINVNRLGISGSVSAEDVAYSFFEADGVSTSVRLEAPAGGVLAPRLYGHALRRVGYGPEAGRILGAKRVKEALIAQIMTRSLPGGRVWTEELVFGRLRHLAREYHAPVSNLDLQGALSILHVDRDAFVGGGLRGGQSFVISDLMADITALIDQGIISIPEWSEGVEALNLRDAADRDRFGRIINEFYRRVQIAYGEIVDQSFPGIREHLHTLTLMPLRYECEVELHNRRGYEDATLHYRRFPAASYSTAGADITFPDVLTNFDGNEAVQVYLARVNALLARFGRSRAIGPAQWGWQGIPDFEGRDTNFDGLQDESVVVRTTMKWLKRDIESIFSEVPTYMI